MIMEKIQEIPHFINGRFFHEADGRKIPVVCPVNGEIFAQVSLAATGELHAAVAAAQAAFPDWSVIPLKERVQVFYRFRTLLEKNLGELAAIIHKENGKTLDEARAEVEKGIELTEFACSLPALLPGEVMEVSKGIECRMDRKPLGVVASIVPFNFPLMVPLWTIPNAIALGNCMILKPSEQVPVSSMHLAEMLQEAGLPDGLFNVVNGDREIVEALCDHDGISAISFVGSTRVAKMVYRRATSRLKRCLALGGAKNHLIVLADANPETTATQVIASMNGCAGQRCMAAASMVAVGISDLMIDRICEEAKKIIPGQNSGAVISREAKERIEHYIDEAERAGAHILVDGRNWKTDKPSGGFYIGPTVMDHVTPDMAIAREEVFGPVLAIIRARDLDEAIAIENRSDYGNAASVFTQNGGLAQQVIARASAGMIGVNIGVPVPREPFSFGGWNESKFGVCDITGRSSIEFWTKLKKTSVKWHAEDRTGWMS